MACLLTLTSAAFGDTSLETARAKLEAAVAELASIRETIAQEREPLAAEMRREENKVIELRRQRERMQRLVDNQGVDLTTLENQAKAYADEASYVISLLSDFFNRQNASLSVAEIPLYQKTFLSVLNQADSENLSAGERLDVQVAGLDTGLGRIEAAVGGLRVEGEAVLPTGELSPGRFAIIGPVTYFASNNNAHAGIVVRGASEAPALIEFNSQDIPTIDAFVQEGRGVLPVDATLGRALALATAEESLLEHFNKGGLWMYPILFFALLAVIIALIKFFQVFSEKNLAEKDIETVLQLVREDKREEALHYAKSLPGPGGAMLVTGLQNMHYSKDLLEEFLMESVLEAKPRLERGISFIALAAAVSPLLGLLGTVTGMIETFKLITLFGTGDARNLSSGISQALITTEFGLVAAIPALILAAIVGRMVASRLAALESDLVTFANGLAGIKETNTLYAA